MCAYIGCRHDAACGSLESIPWTWPLELPSGTLPPPSDGDASRVFMLTSTRSGWSWFNGRDAPRHYCPYGTCTPLSALSHVIFVAAIVARQWARRLEQW